MPKAGDSYIVVIKQSHIDWGGYRHTPTRNNVKGEAYVKIPRRNAVNFNIQRGTLYTASFSDGFPSFTARAAGNSSAGDIYAKQFQGDGDLKAFGRWYASVGAQVGDSVLVEFLSPNSVRFTLI